MTRDLLEGMVVDTREEVDQKLGRCHLNASFNNFISEMHGPTCYQFL